MPSPKKNVAYTFNVSLPSVASPGFFQSNPTLAAGDVKVTTDNGALANISSLPTVSPASSTIVQVVVSQAEMNGDRIDVLFLDASGNEWLPVTVHIVTDDVTINDLVRSTTPANTLDVSAGGEAGIDWGNIGNKTTSNALTGTTIASTQQVDVNTIKTQTVTCAAGVTVNANVGTTQPVNFTGTAGSALVKSDMVDIAGAAVSTSSAQIGVNVVSYTAGQAPLQPTVAGRTLDVTATGGAGVDWGNVENQSATVGLSGTTISTTQQVASVSGAVGSVTGNVGGNVAGSVDSVVGSVGGNVAGSVGSVVGNVGGNLGGFVTGDVQGSVLGNLVGNVNGTLAGFTAGALAQFFTTDTGQVYADAVAGSVVFEIVDNSGGSAPTPAQIATAVWEDLLAGGDFDTVGSIGKLLKDDIDAAISSRMATYSQPTGFLAATFPGEVASRTNITAGTITTVSGNVDGSVGSVVDANAIADAVLKRDWSAVSGASARSVLNALRKLRNSWTIAGSVLTVFQEDDTTPAYTQDLTGTPGADPITAIEN